MFEHEMQMLRFDIEELRKQVQDSSRRISELTSVRRIVEQVSSDLRELTDRVNFNAQDAKVKFERMEQAYTSVTGASELVNEKAANTVALVNTTLQQVAGMSKLLEEAARQIAELKKKPALPADVAKWEATRWSKLRSLAMTYEADGKSRKGAWDDWQPIKTSDHEFDIGIDHILTFLIGACQAALQNAPQDMHVLDMRDVKGERVAMSAKRCTLFLQELAKQIAPTVKWPQ